MRKYYIVRKRKSNRNQTHFKGCFTALISSPVPQGLSAVAPHDPIIGTLTKCTSYVSVPRRNTLLKKNIYNCEAPEWYFSLTKAIHDPRDSACMEFAWHLSSIYWDALPRQLGVHGICMTFVLDGARGRCKEILSFSYYSCLSVFWRRTN